MQRQSMDAEGGKPPAPWIVYRWLQAKKNIRTQQEVEAELRRFAVDRQLSERRGISQSSLSGILSGQRRMSPGFCELITLYVQCIRNDDSFKFPEDAEILLNEMREINENVEQDLIEQSRHYANSEILSIDNQKRVLNHLSGAWHLYFYSRRDSDISRKIRRAIITFSQDHKNENPYAKMSVKSVGKTSIWIGECEKIEKYWYVSIDRK